MALAPSIEIYLVRGPGPYKPGSVLSGQLQITKSESGFGDEMRWVKISCYGLLKSIFPKYKMKKRIVESTIFDHKEVLFCENKVIRLHFQQGIWHQFQFDLPSDLPPSVTSSKCAIEYLIVVKLEGSEEIVSVPFLVEIEANLNGNPLARLPGHFIQHHFVKCFSFQVFPDYVTLEVDIPQRGFIPLESIPFKVKLINQSSHDVKLKALVKQDIIFSEVSCSGRKTEEKVLLQEKEGPTVLAKRSVNWEGRISIPLNAITCSVNSKYVQVHHQLEVVASIPRFRRKKRIVRGCLPIIVGDIPLGAVSMNLPTENESPPPKYSLVIQDSTGLPTYAECQWNMK